MPVNVNGSKAMPSLISYPTLLPDILLIFPLGEAKIEQDFMDSVVTNALTLIPPYKPLQSICRYPVPCIGFFDHIYLPLLKRLYRAAILPAHIRHLACCQVACPDLVDTTYGNPRNLTCLVGRPALIFPAYCLDKFSSG